MRLFDIDYYQVTKLQTRRGINEQDRITVFTNTYCHTGLQNAAGERCVKQIFENYGAGHDELFIIVPVIITTIQL